MSLPRLTRIVVFGSTPLCRSCENVGDTHGSTQNARTIQHPCCGKLTQPRGQILFTQPGVTKINRQREIRAAGMVDRNEGTVRDDIHRLLAAVIRVGAPANVRQQTSGVAQPALIRTFLKSGGLHKTIGPVDQFLAVVRRP